jgi:hypothetical protein
VTAGFRGTPLVRRGRAAAGVRALRHHHGLHPNSDASADPRVTGTGRDRLGTMSRYLHARRSWTRPACSRCCHGRCGPEPGPCHRRTGRSHGRDRSRTGRSHGRDRSRTGRGRGCGRFRTGRGRGCGRFRTGRGHGHGRSRTGAHPDLGSPSRQLRASGPGSSCRRPRYRSYRARNRSYRARNRSHRVHQRPRHARHRR